jgi:hypothetical protein
MLYTESGSRRTEPKNNGNEENNLQAGQVPMYIPFFV